MLFPKQNKFLLLTLRDLDTIQRNIIINTFMKDEAREKKGKRKKFLKKQEKKGLRWNYVMIGFSFLSFFLSFSFLFIESHLIFV